MNNYQRALSGYSNSAGEINSNLGNWRADIDNVAAGNKAGLQNAVASAKEQVDFNALTGIGEEFAIRGAKKYGGALLDKLYNKTGLKSIDQKAGRFIESKVKQAIGNDGIKPQEVEDSGEGVELGDLDGGVGGGKLPMKDPSQRAGETKEDMGDEETKEGDMGDDIEPQAEEPNMSFDEFMDQFKTPMTESGDIDFDEVDRMRNAQAVQDEPQTEQTAQSDGTDVRNNASQNEASENTAEGDDGVDATNPTEAIENATGEADDAVSNVVNDAGDAAKSLVDDGAKALSTAADSAIGDGLEGAGAALDATGVLAPLGVLAQVAGGVLEAGSIYQMGEGLVNWWDTAILGEKPKVDFKATKAPIAPQTLATRGLMAAPTMDSNFDVPSTAGGW